MSYAQRWCSIPFSFQNNYSQLKYHWSNYKCVCFNIMFYPECCRFRTSMTGTPRYSILFETCLLYTILYKKVLWLDFTVSSFNLLNPFTLLAGIPGLSKCDLYTFELVLKAAFNHICSFFPCTPNLFIENNRYKLTFCEVVDCLFSLNEFPSNVLLLWHDQDTDAKVQVVKPCKRVL